MAQCRNCGEELSAAIPFCSHCGALQTEENKAKPSPAVPTPVTPPQESIPHFLAPPSEASPSTQPPYEPISKPAPPQSVPTRTKAPQAAPTAPRIEKVVPAQPATTKPSPALFWVIGLTLVLIVILPLVFASSQSGSKITGASPDGDPVPSAPALERKEEPKKPSIDFSADEPIQENGHWVSTLHWSIQNAASARITAKAFDETADPESGSKTITLENDPTTVTLTAKNKAGDTSTSTVTCKAIPSTSPIPSVPPNSDTLSVPSPTTPQPPQETSQAKSLALPEHWKQSRSVQGSEIEVRFGRDDNPDVAILLQENLTQKVPDGGNAESYMTDLVDKMNTAKTKQTRLQYENMGVSHAAFMGRDALTWDYVEKSNKTPHLRSMKKHLVVYPAETGQVMIITEIRPQDSGTLFDEEINSVLAKIWPSRADPENPDNLDPH